MAFETYTRLPCKWQAHLLMPMTMSWVLNDESLSDCLESVCCMQCVGSCMKTSCIGLDVHPIAKFAVIKLNRKIFSKFHFLAAECRGICVIYP